MQILNLRHIGIPTADLESTVAAWQKMGFEIKSSGQETINGREINWVKMENQQGYCIEVLDGGSFHVAFTVDEVVKDHYYFQAPSGVKIQFSRGPDGIGLEFVEENQKTEFVCKRSDIKMEV